MPHDLGRSLRAAIDRELAQLQGISDADAAAAPRNRDGWTRKDELGHLLDSAVNNHLRFVRASLEDSFQGPGYDQNGWVTVHAYNQLPWVNLVDFWYRHNTLLAHVVDQIPDERLLTLCRIGSSQPVTLRFLIEDYVLHMMHHLDHILSREKMTEYPGAAVGV